MVARTREQTWWGGLQEGVTVDVGPKTPGAGRKTREGRPLASPRRHPGLWEKKEVEEEARVQRSSPLPGGAAASSAGSLHRASCSGAWGGPSDTAPGAGLGSPVSGPPVEGGAARGPRVGGAPGRCGAEPGSRTPPVIRSSGRGAVSGSSLQIRCEQAQVREVAIASGDASSPAFLGTRWRSWQPGSGQLDAARWAVRDWGGRSGAWRGWRWWQLETLEFALTP